MAEEKDLVPPIIWPPPPPTAHAPDVPFSESPPPLAVPPETFPPETETSPPPGVPFESPPKPLWQKILPPLLGILVLIILVFIFLRIFRSSTPKEGPITLNWWGLWEEAQIVTPIISAYESTHPKVKINYQKESPIQYRERLQSALARGEGPDIFRFHNTWLPMLKNDLAPLPGNVMDEGTFANTFYPAALKDLKSGNQIYGLPLEFEGLALFYNEDLFKNAGVSPPTTWEELQRAAQTLTVKDRSGKIVTAGIALGTAGNIEHFSDIVATMLLQNGADFKNLTQCLQEAGKEVCPAADALSFYTLFSLGERKVWDDTLPPSVLAFAQGKVAMIFAPSWEIFIIKGGAPNLKFKVLPLPQLSEKKVSWASFWVEGVAQKSQHQKEAWEFLKYLVERETQTKFYNEAAKIRLFGEPYSRVDLADSLKTDPYVGVFIQQAPTAQSFYLASKTFDNGLNDKMIKYFEDAVNSVNRGVSPKAAIETAAKGANQVLATYGITLP